MKSDNKDPIGGHRGFDNKDGTFNDDGNLPIMHMHMDYVIASSISIIPHNRYYSLIFSGKVWQYHGGIVLNHYSFLLFYEDYTAWYDRSGMGYLG